MTPASLLIGPFVEVATFESAPLGGALEDSALEIRRHAGILVRDGFILDVGSFDAMLRSLPPGTSVHQIREPLIAVPGFIDAHTHLCFAGSRSRDYAMRIAGSTYQQILAQGGGIHDTVSQTRAASTSELAGWIRKRALRHLSEGVTTIEVKTGYGLTPDEEIRHLQAIRLASMQNMPAHSSPDLIPTCLAAHVPPPGTPPATHLLTLVDELLPRLADPGTTRARPDEPHPARPRLTERIDIFVEEGAFTPRQARPYLDAARALGFDVTIHAEQFSSGGVDLAVECGAVSADHLECLAEPALSRLARSGTVAMALPGASMGLGLPYAPARKLLDAGAILAIATDWNPGSAPMGDLLLQAAVLGASERLSTAETLAAITFRAARALRLGDRGRLRSGQLADIAGFPADDHREILYQQGRLRPSMVWRKGVLIHHAAAEPDMHDIRNPATNP